MEIEISSADPRAGDAILAHLGWTADIAIVTSDGTGAALLPRGSLEVRAVSTNGDGAEGLGCLADADLPGAFPLPSVPEIWTDSAGFCEMTLPSTGYWVFLQDDAGQIVGLARAVVSPYETSRVTITIQE